MPAYVVYADGSCLGNPGPGAAAVVICDEAHCVLKEFARKFTHTTNNRMELTAAIAALQALPDGEITLIMDSQYVLRGITGWIVNWKRRGWLTANKTPVENRDLWEQLDALTHGRTIRWEYVKGHSGTAHDRVDALAQATARS